MTLVVIGLFLVVVATIFLLNNLHGTSKYFDSVTANENDDPTVPAAHVHEDPDEIEETRIVGKRTPPSPVTVVASSQKIDYPKCATNPYEGSIKETFDVVIETAQDWLDHQVAYYDIARRKSYERGGHGRFFPFEVMATCEDVQCVGGACSEDASKYACGLSRLGGGGGGEECVVYSIGGNNKWQFEEDLLNRTNCHIHTFDCTGPKSRFTLPHDENNRLSFHHICLGAKRMKGIGNDSPRCDGRRQLCGDTWTLEQIQRHLGHDRIDLLKLDIEGWEWPIFDIEYTNATMPMQVLVEVHYTWGKKGTRGVIHDKTMGSAEDLVRLQGRLLKMGLVTVHRDDNPSCPWCSELTLLRVAC